MVYTINRAGLDLPGLVQTALSTLTGMALTDSVVYTPGTSAVYDPSTGAVSNTATAITFNGVITRFGESELDNQIIVTTDAKLLCSALDLTVEPSHTDTLVSKGNTWKVVRTIGVPTNGFWKIHIRRV